MCEESQLQEAIDWLNGNRADSALKTALENPLKSRQDELEVMTRDRDFDINPEWRKMPWMRNYPTKKKLN